MTDAEFRARLDEEVTVGRMTEKERDDLLDQKRVFDEHLPPGDTSLRREFQGRIVGYVAGERRIDWEIHKLLDSAKETYPGRMIYFEPIGFDLY